MSTQMHRLHARLRDHEKMYSDVLAFLRAYGFGPGDPLVVEVETSLRQVRGLMETVRVAMLDFAPYRPLANPWRSSGLSAQLKPDFKARGVAGRDDSTGWGR